MLKTIHVLLDYCRQFALNNNSGVIVNFSASTGIVSARPDLYNGGHKHPAYSISKAGVINLRTVSCHAPAAKAHSRRRGSA